MVGDSVANPFSSVLHQTARASLGYRPVKTAPNNCLPEGDKTSFTSRKYNKQCIFRCGMSRTVFL